MKQIGSCWPQVSLYELCNPKQWPTIPQTEFVDRGYPVYGANGKIGYYTKFNHEQPTVLITCRGATCGAINVCEPKSYVTGNAMALDGLEETKVTVEYLAYALRQGILLKAITGTAQPQITRQSLMGISVPLPPVVEQRRIAEILDRAEALRANRRAALAQLDTLIQAIFLDLFGCPVVSQTKWPVLSLSEACAKITDGTHNSPPVEQRGVPYITAKHLKEYGLDFHSDPWFISEENHRAIFARCDPRPGDVLYIKDGATTGIAGINRYDFEFSMLSSLALLRPNRTNLQSEYLCFWLNNPAVKQKLIGGMAGAAIRRLTLSKLNAIRIPIPPLSLQAEFTRAVLLIEELKNAHRASLNELDALFVSLQHRAFRGEL